MKLLYVLFIVFVYINGSLGNDSATRSCIVSSIATDENATKHWLDMDKNCIKSLESQVNVEIKAAMTYLAMGAHFGLDVINRPGFSKFFFESATEEREHAIKVLEYLLMRGQLTNINEDNVLLRFPLEAEIENWNSGYKALKKALKLETSVTKKIRELIKTCEHPNDLNLVDYHLVDYLTGEFLTEQYKGQRDLAGKISSLGKMIQTHGMLGEFLFDKKLLNNEI